MIELAYLSDIEQAKSLPNETKKVIEELLQVLNTEYGANRDKYKDDGGYVVVIEKKEDFIKIKDKAYIDCDTVIAEYVDKIVCSNGEIYTNSLILCNNDYAISIIISLELTPQNFKNYMIY